MSYWTESYSIPVAFATWVLQRDGLRVPPFDAHPAGNGRLQALGLDQPTWLAWVEQIVEAEVQQTSALSTIDLRNTGPDERRALAQVGMQGNPAARWPGGSEGQRQLETLWREFQPIGEAWAQSLTSTKRQKRISAGQQRRLWHQLKPLLDRRIALHVYPVDYVQVVALPIAPSSCVVGIGAPDRQGPAYVEAVSAAANALAGIEGR